MAKARGRRHVKSVDNLDLSRSEIESLIDEWIFNERNREILKRRLLDGIIYDDLAEEFDLSIQQVKNIVYREQDKLFAKVSF